MDAQAPVLGGQSTRRSSSTVAECVRILSTPRPVTSAWRPCLLKGEIYMLLALPRPTEPLAAIRNTPKLREASWAAHRKHQQDDTGYLILTEETGSKAAALRLRTVAQGAGRRS